jgi:hypothetical protein
MSDNASPLESLFGIEPGSTPPVVNQVQLHAATEMIDPETGEIIQRSADPTNEELKREERIADLQVDAQLNEVHSAAMQAFYHQHGLTGNVDPKFSARNSEVAAQFLAIALNATTAKAKTKYDRQKIRIAQNMGNSPGTVNNNLIVADRNDLLRSLFNQDFEKTMEQQLKQEILPEKA